MQTLSIRPMQKEDLDHIISIESSVFPDPWTFTMFSEQLDLPQMYSLITARLEDEVVGYGGLLRIRDEGHITNLAVQPQKHGMGIGKSIIYFLFLLALKEQLSSITLEVRTTNIRAQQLYEKFGFQIIASRKNYYGYEDDAFVMMANEVGEPSFQRNLEEIRKNLNFSIIDYVNLAS